MNIKTIIFLLIGLTFILLIVPFIFLIKKNINRKKQNEIKKIEQNLNIKKIEGMNIIIQEIKIIANKELKWKNIEYKLIDLYNEIEDLILKLKKKLKKNISYKEKKQIIKELKNDINKINILEKHFYKESKEITQQKEYLNKEFIFYRQKIRIVKDNLKKNMILIEKTFIPINNYLNEIKKQEINYEKFLENFDIKSASIILEKYIKNIKKITIMLSEAKTIEIHLYSTIKKYINNLIDFFNREKENLNDIEFEKNIKEINKIYIDAKAEYLKLNFKQTKLKIKKIYKNIKYIENIINYEILCCDKFLSKKDLVIKESKEIFNNFKKIKNKIKKKIRFGEILSNKIEANIQKIKNKFKDFKISFEKFENCVQNKNILYSSKLEIMKDLLIDIKYLIDKINETMKDIWSLNIEYSILKNRFKKSKVALEELNINIKNNDILLNKEDIKLKENAENLMLDIYKKINEYEMNEEIKEKINLLSSNTSSLYNIINGKIKIAEISKNLINHLASKRFENLSLNLNKAENFYLEGKYIESLNLIIEEMQNN